MSNEQDCDLDKTLELIDLFKVPREERDMDWVEDFFENVATASLMALEPQIQRGGDGFPYLTLGLPKPNEDFDAFSINHSLDYCLKKGCGIALFSEGADPNGPEWVFSFGSLWAYDRFGNFIGDPSDERPDFNDANTEVANEAKTEAAGETETGGQNDPQEEPREVQVSQPPEDFLPTYARTALGRFFKDVIGLDQPRVALVTDPKNKPSRLLMFTDLLPERFENREQFLQLMTAIRWFLPPTRGLAPAMSQVAQYGSPLQPNKTAPPPTEPGGKQL